MEYNVKEFIAKALFPISRLGYTKNTTAEYIMNNFNDLQPRAAEDVEEFLEWVSYKYNNKPSDYMDSVYLVVNSPKIVDRALNIICSAINLYLKDVQRRKEIIENDSQYVGKIKDKIQLTIKSIQFLYSKYYGFGYSGTEYNVYRIIDTEGNAYIWGTSNEEFDVGDTIMATVKDHREYNGEKQTVITRGRVIYSNQNEDLDIYEVID